MVNNYQVDLKNEKLTAVENEEVTELNNSNATYDGMISQADTLYQDQINAARSYAETQKKNQQAATDFAIEEINQQKAYAKKDYLKEQSGAYTDWQKESNKYGANAEAMAAQGMTGTGYSESSQVSMYNTYQNRVATARENFAILNQNFDNAITEARLQNSSALAEIAYTALEKCASLAIEAFQYKNTLLIEKANKGLEIKKMYQDQWNTVYNQLLAERKIESIEETEAKIEKDTDSNYDNATAPTSQKLSDAMNKLLEGTGRYFIPGVGIVSKDSVPTWKTL